MLFGLICLAPMTSKKEEKSEEDTLLDPEYYRRYKWYGDSMSEKVTRKLDHSKILDKPYIEKKEKEPKKPRERRVEEENPFAELWS